MYKLVIFDFDGTLADSFGWFLDVVDTIADRFGFERMDRSDLDALRRMDNRELIRRHRVPSWKLPMIAAHMRKVQGQGLDAIRPFDGVPEMLAELDRRGVITAVVTSNARDNVERVLGPAARHIRYFGCGSSLFGKAAKFRQVIRAAGMAPHDVLSVGDELRDIEAARAVGCAAGAVSWGYALPQRLSEAKPDYMFTRPGDIGALVTADRPC